MRGQPTISPVYRLCQPAEASCPERHFAKTWDMMRKLWTERGIIAAYPNELPDDLRIALEKWATESYGRRKSQ